MISNLNMILTDFSIVRPRYETNQPQTLQWLASAHAAAEQKTRQGDASFDCETFRKRMEKLLFRYGCGPENIGMRGHESSDFLHLDWKKMDIFNLDESVTGKGMRARNHFFSNAVDRIFDELYPVCSLPPRHLIHVTCTGYISPSGAQRLVSKRDWGRTTEVTHLYHMGCYASLPALRVAQGFLSAPRDPSHVDIVHTELCALHLNPSMHAPEQLVVQSLFADGFIRYTVNSTKHVSTSRNLGLEVIALREEIVPNSATAMQWVCSDWGMEMVLSKDVPDLIALHLKPYLVDLFQQAGWNYSEVWEKAIWAIHPGGPKIIEKVQALLELSDNQVAPSKRVLFECGNMSSSTLPHIWQKIISNERIALGTPVISLAFGPGLTMSGGLFRKV